VRSEALLNPQAESAVCRRMISLAEDQVKKLDLALTTSVLEREHYLQKIGAAAELRRLIDNMKVEYAREFNV